MMNIRHISYPQLVTDLLLCVTQGRHKYSYLEFPTHFLAKEASLSVISGRRLGCCSKRGISSFDRTQLCRCLVIRVVLTDLSMLPLVSSGQLCTATFIKT